MTDAAPQAGARWPQLAIAVATLVLAALLAFGARGIAGDAGYAGVGPNFLPWAVSAVLGLCGALLLWHALAGGWRDMEAPSGATQGDWPPLLWVCAGVLVNAAFITGFTVPGLGLKVPQLGFIVSCTLCYALAVRGLRQAEGKPHGGLPGVARDLAVGALIAAPAFWLFTQVLGINLPGLTGTGWL